MRLVDPIWPWMTWRHRAALGLVVMWAWGLVFVRWGVAFEALQSLPVVGEAAHCRLGRPPAPAETVAMLAAHDVVVARGFEAGGDTICLHVELADGQRAMLPWHRSYLVDRGYRVSFGP
ncbi:MAG: hypothetical protein B7733_07120 [Myxococcales bacterium FL481]|nr:MAG: hypothetical protein B7733_07120 [Myxococcales bacterium FL481]